MKYKSSKLSLRSKMVFTLSGVVITVSCVLLYLTTSMIVDDKKAYIYDSVFQSLDRGNGSLDEFFSSKLTLINALQPNRLIPEVYNREQFSSDSDLYQVSYIKLSGVESGTKVQSLYENDKFLEIYKKRESFLKLKDDFFLSLIDDVKTNKTIHKLYFEKGQAPRFIVSIYNSESKIIYYFDFLLDNLYAKNFEKQTFEFSLVNSRGNSIFHNKAYEDSANTQMFYRNFISEKLKTESASGNSGVFEQIINKDEYILGYKQLKFFPEYFIFSGIKTKDAYEVTTILIVNTVVYSLFLVGFFNLLSIAIARSITNPLEKLTEVINTISQGRYNVRVDKQSTAELQLLANSFNEMVQKIRDYQNKLVEYNKTLELKVEERTQDLQQANGFITAMVDSLAQGLLVFGKDGVCLDLHTKACEELVGMDPTGEKLGNILQVEDKELFNYWLENLFEEMIPFESIVELGQKSLPCNVDYKSKDFKHITLEFFPMRDAEEKVKNVVLVASDKTREFKAFKEVEEQQNFAKLVSKVLKDKMSFLRFTNIFNDSMNSLRVDIVANGVINKEDLLRLIHSMKGSASFYSLQDVVNHLHDFESDLLNASLSDEEILQKIDTAFLKMDESVKAIKDMLGDTSKHVIEIEETKLRSFYDFLYTRNTRVANEFASQFLYWEVKNYISQYQELIPELAIKLNKKIHPMSIVKGDTLVDRDYFQEFFDSCIHIFRNVVDHAIERPEVRSNTGKPEEGTIKVSFDLISSDTASLLEFNVQDDGAGINAEIIRRKMKELNYPIEVIEKNDEDIIYHIFDASFSTAEQVTDVSGRGVGLFDIKKNVEKLKGTIEIQTKVGMGTVFTFLLPIPKPE